MFFFLQRWHWKSSSRMHIGETLTHQITFRNICRLWWSSAFNEIPSWQMNGQLAEWHESEAKNRTQKTLTAVAVIMFTNTWSVPCKPPPPPQKGICMIYESLIFRSENPDFQIYPEESHPCYFNLQICHILEWHWSLPLSCNIPMSNLSTCKTYSQIFWLLHLQHTAEALSNISKNSVIDIPVASQLYSFNINCLFLS